MYDNGPQPRNKANGTMNRLLLSILGALQGPADPKSAGRGKSSEAAAAAQRILDSGPDDSLRELGIELFDELKATAKALTVAYRHRLRIGELYRKFAAAGHPVDAPASFAVTPAEVAVVVKSFVHLGLIEPTDSLLIGIDLNA